MQHKEPTRVRKQGTIVVTTENGDEKIAALRAIVASGQYGKLNGVMIDTFSASAITKVYDALNDDNKAKFKALSIGRMATLAFHFVK